MAENVIQLPLRSDPFGLGLDAHRNQVAREHCPFPPEHIEGMRWLAGWEHAAFMAGSEERGAELAPGRRHS